MRRAKLSPKNCPISAAGRPIRRSAAKTHGWKTIANATRIGGSIAFIGVLAGRAQDESRISLMVMHQQRLQGVTVGSVEDLQAMADAIAANRMKPVMDKNFAFADTKPAFAYMASGAHFGKVAIAIG